MRVVVTHDLQQRQDVPALFAPLPRHSQNSRAPIAAAASDNRPLEVPLRLRQLELGHAFASPMTNTVSGRPKRSRT